MEAGVPSDQVRELFLVDGAVWRFNPFLDPQKRNWDRQSFRASFRSAEGFEKVSPTVQTAFAHHMAEYFERLREEGRYQDSATWRGQEAATQFIEAVDMIRESNGLDGHDTITTGALLWALGSMELRRPSSREGRRPSAPG
jgi:hypothetical protein